MGDLFVHGSRTRIIAERIWGGFLAVFIVVGFVCAYLNRLDPNHCGI